MELDWTPLSAERQERIRRSLGLSDDAFGRVFRTAMGEPPADLTGDAKLLDFHARAVAALTLLEERSAS